VNARQHWEQIYRTKRPAEVSWYAPHLNLSLRLIEEAAPNRDAAIIDVGGGEATLVDDLLNLGYRRLSVLDVSATALDVAKNRLDQRAGAVDWLCGDVTTFPFARHGYDAWQIGDIATGQAIERGRCKKRTPRDPVNDFKLTLPTRVGVVASRC
jgi:SAM-dependent methyltransferase